MNSDIDGALEAAVREIVQENGQSDSTANKLIAWLKAMSTGDLVVHEQEQFLERALSSLIVKDQTSEN